MLTVKKASLSAFALTVLFLGSTAQAAVPSLDAVKKKAFLAVVAAAMVGTYQLYTQETWKSVPTLAEDADLVETLKFYWNRYWVGQKGRDSVVKARVGTDGKMYLVAKKKKNSYGVLGNAQTLVGLAVMPALAVAGNYNATMEAFKYALKAFGLESIGEYVPTLPETAARKS